MKNRKQTKGTNNYLASQLVNKKEIKVLARSMAYTLRNQVGSDPKLETSESGICSTWNKGGQARL